MRNQIDPISTMQKYLQILRKINGWTAESLGRRLGVTKQTISNLENSKVIMTRTQYIALRTIFEYEVREIGTNDVLKKVLCILFYSNMNCISEDAQSIYEALENIAAAAFGGINGAQLTLLSSTLLASINPLSGVNVNYVLKSTHPYAWLEEITQQEVKD